MGRWVGGLGVGVGKGEGGYWTGTGLVLFRSAMVGMLSSFWFSFLLPFFLSFFLSFVFLFWFDCFLVRHEVNVLTN